MTTPGGRTNLNIDQRAYIVGEQGICPECERNVDWSDIDPNWYLCNDCVCELLAGGPAVVAHQRLRDLSLHSGLGVDQGSVLETSRERREDHGD